MSKMMIIPNPYAGLSGTGNTVQLRSLEDRVIIRLVPVQYFLMIFVLMAFGGLLVLIALRGFPDRRGGWVYHGMQYGCWAFAAVLACVLIRYLRGMPRIEIPRGSGEMLFFKYRAGQPEFIVRWPEVERFSLRVEPYLLKQKNYPQHVLYLEKKEGRSIPLCGSVDEKLMNSIKTQLEQLMSLRTDAAWPS